MLFGIIHVIYILGHFLAIKGLVIGYEFAEAMKYGEPLYFDDLARAMIYVGGYEIISILVIIYDIKREIRKWNDEFYDDDSDDNYLD